MTTPGNNNQSQKEKEDKELILFVSKAVIDALPHPAMIINANRQVLAANQMALETGAVVGAYCWKEFGKSAFLSCENLRLSREAPDTPGIKCSFCLANESLQRQSKENDPNVQSFGRQLDTYWVAINQNIYLHYAIDVTDHVRTTHALKESEERLSAALEANMDGLWDWDIQGQTTYFNETFYTMLGYTPNEFPPSFERFIERVHSEDQAAVKQAVKDHLSGITSKYSVEFRFPHKAGEILWILSRGKVVDYDTNGKPLRLIGTHTDISEHKRAEEERIRLKNQLHQAQKIESIGQLAGGVAHDFNNMLGVILGHAELALMKADSGQPLVEDLEAISIAAKRSADLTRQLLTFARKQTIAPRVLDLNETVADTLSMLQRLIGENIHLSWNPAANLWPVKVDPIQVNQILTNLCVNSRDAIGGIGKVRIETGHRSVDESFSASRPCVLPGDYVRLTISDDGCGMDQEILTRIFEPFFTTKEVGKGTGLGLATVFGAVKQNKGFIDVFSDPGQGTAFHIHFPRIPSQSMAAQESVARALPGGTETILLVEDDAMVLRLTTTMLEKTGYTVLAASGIDLAIAFAKKHSGPIQLLLTDLIMPEMNGRDLRDILQVLRPEMKVIFMSGYTDDLISKQGVIEDSLHFLQKPVSFETLTTKVREVLDS